MKFRKRPVEIEAVQYTGLTSIQECVTFCPTMESHLGRIVVPTLEGNMSVSVGDWIIRGVAGEFYPCKHNIFLKTYEQVS